MKKIAILGSTGSIGRNTLKVIDAHPDEFQVSSLVAGSNIKVLAQQIEQYHPLTVSVKNKESAAQLQDIVRARVKILSGIEGAIECAANNDADVVVSAIVGAAGLAPTLAAIKAGKSVALANKETLVTAGELVMAEARLANVEIIPIDSEHSAIFQALKGEERATVKKIILTASGGPFLHKSAEELANVTIEEALNHPNWSMGRKITIDSATMMNKGLEVIEARWLFDLPPEMVEVVVHPQSIVHSMVEFHDSSIIAQMGKPDMRGPISFALGFPDRLKTPLPSLDFTKSMKLSFEPPDVKKFPALALAYEALRMGGSATAVLNSSNEVAVERFLSGEIEFEQIPLVVEKVLEQCEKGEINSLADALGWDKFGRDKAKTIVKGL